MSQTTDVVIVGGGVIGCSIAYYLAKVGVSVTVLERDLVGSHASGVSAGILSHYIEGDNDDPYAILVRASHNMFPKLAEEIRELTSYDIEYLRCGVLSVADNDADLTDFMGFTERHAGLANAPRMVDESQVRELWPFAHRRYIGGVLDANEGQVNSPRFVRGLALAAERSGARIFEGHQATGIRMENNRVCSVATSQGDISAGAVVLAAGPWTGIVGGLAGRRIPVRPVRGQVVHLHTNRRAMSVVVHTPNTFTLQRADGTILVGATVEEVGFDCRLTADGIASQLQAGLAEMPALAECTFNGARVALRPGSPREMPYVGRLNGIDNLIVASGHFRTGILLAPITGQIVADIVSGIPVDPRLSTLNPDAT